MIDLGPAEDWEIWVGASLAVVVPANDPDKPWLTRFMKLKYRMEGVTRLHAHLVFDRGLARGYLIHTQSNRSNHKKEDTDAD